MTVLQQTFPAQEARVQFLDELYQTAHALLADPESSATAVERAYLRIARQNAAGRKWTRAEYYAVLVGEVRRLRSGSLARTAAADDEILTRLRQLPAGQAEVTVLHDGQGFTYSEIQRILDIPLKTVGELLTLGRSALSSAVR